MAFLKEQRRVDLRNLAIELGEDPSLDLKIPELKKLILRSANYVEEEARGTLEVIILERTKRQECEKLKKEREFELKMLELKNEIKLLKIRNKRKITPREDLPKIVKEEPLEENGKESIEVNEDGVSGEIEKEKMVVKKWRGSEHEECENEEDEASEEVDGKESIEVKEDEVSGEKEEEKIVDKKWRGSEHEEECENEEDEASEEEDGKESIELKEDDVSGEMKEEKMIVKKWRGSEHGEGRERGTEVGMEDEEAKALYKESEMEEAKAEIREEEKVPKKKYEKFISKSKVKKFAAAPTRRGKRQKTAPEIEVTGSDDDVSSEEEKPVKKHGRQPPKVTPTKRRSRTTVSKYAKDYSWIIETPNRKGKEAKKKNSATTVRCGSRRRKPTESYTEDSACEVEGEQSLENDDYEPEKRANSKKKSTTDNAFDELWCFKGGTLSEDLDGDENDNLDNADGLAHEDE